MQDIIQVILTQSVLFDNSQLTKSAWVRLYNPDMEIIYVDSLFCLNVLADYLLCLVSARACGLYLRRMRYFMAALIGAAYSVCVFLPGMAFLMTAAGKLACLLLMGLIAFGGEKHPFRCTLVFLAVSAGFAGMAWGISMAAGLSSPAGIYLPVSFRVSLLSFALCYGVCSLFFARRGSTGRRCLVSVHLEHLGGSADFKALYDTGNSLSDPASGKKVMVVSQRVLVPIFGKDSPLLSGDDAVGIVQRSAADPALFGKLRLIPYSALGGQGLLPAFQADKLFADGKAVNDVLIAVSPRLSGEDFDAVI